MRRGSLPTGSFVLACALAAPGVGATPRAEVDGSVSLLAWTDSAWRDALRAFDRAPSSVGVMVAGRALRPLSQRVAVGGRLGWAWSQAAVDAGGVAYNPAGVMDFHLLDASGVLRVYATPLEARRLRVHLDLELGAVLGTVSTLGVDDRWVRPRVDLSAFLGGRLGATTVVLGGRVGAQYVPWDGAGGAGFDPAFAALHVGLEVGGLP